MLNTQKFNNYAFFCPVSRLHLTVSSPVGYANEVTAAILRALKAQTILDVDGVVDIETGTVKAAGATNVNPVKENKTPEQPKSSESENNGSADESNNAPEVTVNDADATAETNADADATAENNADADENATVNADAEKNEDAVADAKAKAETEDKPKKGRKAKADAE